MPDAEQITISHFVDPEGIVHTTLELNGIEYALDLGDNLSVGVFAVSLMNASERALDLQAMLTGVPSDEWPAVIRRWAAARSDHSMN